MKSFKTFITEKRAHADKNPKVDSLTRLKEISSNSLYITFADVNKAGIKPQQNYDTPHGIFTYPLGMSLKNYGVKKITDFPYASSRKYIIVYKNTTPNFVYTESYTTEMLKKDLKALSGMTGDFHSVYGKAIRWIGDIKNELPSLESSADKELVNKVLKIASDEMTKGAYTYDGLIKAGVDIFTALESATEETSLIIRNRITGLGEAFIKGGERERDDYWLKGHKHHPVATLFFHTRAVAEQNITKWRSIFVKLGYEGIVDNGHGIIHPSEHTQAVWFSTKYLKHVETIRNTPHEFQGLISFEDALIKIGGVGNWEMGSKDTLSGKSVWVVVGQEGDEYNTYVVRGMRPVRMDGKYRPTKEELDVLAKYKAFIDPLYKWVLPRQMLAMWDAGDWISVAKGKTRDDLFLQFMVGFALKKLRNLTTDKYDALWNLTKDWYVAEGAKYAPFVDWVEKNKRNSKIEKQFNALYKAFAS